MGGLGPGGLCYPWLCIHTKIFRNDNIIIVIIITSSLAQGGGGSFKKMKTIGEIACCESRMPEKKQWPTDYLTD